MLLTNSLKMLLMANFNDDYTEDIQYWVYPFLFSSGLFPPKFWIFNSVRSWRLYLSEGLLWIYSRLKMQIVTILKSKRGWCQRCAQLWIFWHFTHFKCASFVRERFQLQRFAKFVLIYALYGYTWMITIQAELICNGQIFIRGIRWGEWVDA